MLPIVRGDQEAVCAPIHQPPIRVSQCRILVPFYALALICLSGLALEESAFAQETPRGTGIWKTAAPAPTKRTEVVAATVGGKIYVVG